MNSKVSRRLVATAALAVGLGLFAAGCSAGQVTQTGSQVAAVDGASGDVGPIAVRNAMFAYPHEGNRWEQGAEVAMTVVIANSGSTPDKLLSISSPFFTGDAEITGGNELPARFALRAEAQEGSHGSPTSSAAHSTSSAHSSSSGHASVTSTSAPTSSSSVAPTSSNGNKPSGSSSVKPTSSSSKPASDLPVGHIKITCKGLVQEFVAGQTVKVTFLFEKAGPLTLDVPLAPSTHPRTADDHGSGGH